LGKKSKKVRKNGPFPKNRKNFGSLAAGGTKSKKKQENSKKK
jgi:hypothetical protein